MKKLLNLFLLVSFSVMQAQEITLVSSDGKQFTIEREKAEKSITLKNLIEDVLQEGQGAPLPLPNIDGATLEIIVNCLKEPEGIEGSIASLSGSALYEFNKAVAYLDIPDIYEKLPAIVWLRKKLQGIIASPVLSGHEGAVSEVAISPDGKFIVTCSKDKTVRIWDTDGTQRAVLGGSFYKVAISPDGKFIVTASFDNAIRIWFFDNHDYVGQLDINHINLITQIYEQAKQKQKLDLRQKPADNLEIREEKKMKEDLFRKLPQEMQAVLRDAVILPLGQ